MAKLTTKQIHAFVLDLLEQAEGGIRWSEMIEATHLAHPETPLNTIGGALVVLLKDNELIAKVARGTYQLVKYQEAQAEVAVAQEQASSDEPLQIETTGKGTVILLEADFYQSFASWLADTAEEVNVAVALGGSILKGKWGTPDVLGVLKPRTQDILKYETQVVTAEIKIDANQPVVAFGQAMAYRLFSHKSFIVVPNTTSEDDLSRLKALCSIHGLGLVTFLLDKQSPEYTMIVIPRSASPDMFYSNQMLRRLLDSAPTLFNKLFS